MFVLRLITLSFVLLSFSGCAYQRATEFAISPAFTPEQQEAILTCFDTWFEAAPELETPLYIGESKGLGAVRISDDFWRCADPQVFGATEKGTDRFPTIHVCMKNIEAQADDFGVTVSRLFAMTIMHEIGHATSLRSEHLPPGNVMGLSVAAFPDAPTKADLAYVRGEPLQ